MKIVQVTYTTRDSFVAQNQKNIQNVMNDLNVADGAGITYISCLQSDGKTFVHTGYFQSENDQKVLNELPSFKLFQEALKSSGLEVPPKQEILTLVGSSNLFNS